KKPGLAPGFFHAGTVIFYRAWARSASDAKAPDLAVPQKKPTVRASIADFVIRIISSVSATSQGLPRATLTVASTESKPLKSKNSTALGYRYLPPPMWTNETGNFLFSARKKLLR